MSFVINASLIDIWWMIGLPVVCLCSALANTLNICVLVQLRSRRNTIFNYMMWNCVAYLLYSLISVFAFMLRVRDEHPPHSTAATSATTTALVDIYEIYFYFYAATALRLFSTMVELWIALERLLLINSKFAWCSTSERSGFLLSIFALVSALVSLPFLFFTSTTNTAVSAAQAQVIPELPYHHLQPKFGPLVFGIQLLLPISLLTVLVVVINKLMCASLRRQASVRLRLRAPSLPLLARNHAVRHGGTTTGPTQTSAIAAAIANRSGQRGGGATRSVTQRDRKITNFVVVMCVLILLGNVCHLMAVLARFLLVVRSATFGVQVFILTNKTLLFGIQSATSFVYYRFNAHFRASLRTLFRLDAT